MAAALSWNVSNADRGVTRVACRKQGRSNLAWCWPVERCRVLWPVWHLWHKAPGRITAILFVQVRLQHIGNSPGTGRKFRAGWQVWCARIPAITMRNRFLARLLVTSTVLIVFACPANAELITFNSRTTFNAAAPGLPVETFDGTFAEGGVLICLGPLMKGHECPRTPGTVDPPSGPVGLLPGITYSSTSSVLVLVGPNSFVGFDNTSNVLGPFAAGDTLDLTFVYASAIGFDVFPGFVAPGQIVISVFDSVNAPMGRFPILASPSGTFFGVLSGSERIGRINVDTVAELPGGLVDDVAFGATIPEPATILLLGSGLAGLGALARRGRKHRPPRQPN
jgi:hypothetical protein